MMRAKMRTILAATAILLAPTVASAQWNTTAVGVAEVDTENTLLLLAGLSASPGGAGLAPLVGLQASYLTFDAIDRVNVFTARPYVGVRSGYTGGSAYGTVGYAFSNREDDVGAVAADRGEGVVVSGGLDHWGTGGPLGYQLLGSYNFGSESYWTRGRVTTRLGQSSRTRIGGEVALLGGDGYEAWQPGVVLEFHNGAGRILGLGAGAKLYDGGDDAFYFRVEGVLPLSRR